MSSLRHTAQYTEQLRALNNLHRKHLHRKHLHPSPLRPQADRPCTITFHTLSVCFNFSPLFTLETPALFGSTDLGKVSVTEEALNLYEINLIQ